MYILQSRNRLQCNLQQAIVSGTLHIATVDGGTMFFHDSIDFSSYAGNDTDTTKYLFVFYDSTGKSAQAYAGAVGGGATYTDIINGDTENGNFETGNPPTGWNTQQTPETFEQSSTQKHGGSYSAHIVDSTPSYGGFSKSFSLTANALYTTSFWYYLTSGSIYGGIDYATATYSTLNTWTQVTQYWTKAQVIALKYQNTSNASAAEFYIDDVVFQRVTDIPVTGLHLISSKNGSTRNMKSVESGFNPNTITRVNIYRAL
ncbi:MAG: hypothetical protein WC332_01460 [Clostridia bacterium]|jgi:hypothetical protein